MEPSLARSPWDHQTPRLRVALPGAATPTAQGPCAGCLTSELDEAGSHKRSQDITRYHGKIQEVRICSHGVRNGWLVMVFVCVCVCVPVLRL